MTPPHTKAREPMSDQGIDIEPVQPKAFHQRVIDATQECVNRLGLDRTKVDDIAEVAGISRATLYRRYGNKDAILEALIGEQVGPAAQAAIGILMAREGGIAQRIELALVRGVLEMPRQPWLENVFEATSHTQGQALFHATYRQRIRAVLHLLLKEPGIRTGLDLEATLSWFLRELLALLAMRPCDEATLRRHIRCFILPVFVPDHAFAKTLVN